MNTLNELEEMGFYAQSQDFTDETVTFCYDGDALKIELECECVRQSVKNGWNFNVGIVKEAAYKKGGCGVEWDYLDDFGGKSINTNRLASLIATHDPNSPLYERELKREF